MGGARIPHDTEHSLVAQPGAEGTCNPFLAGEPASPWARHQERAHKLSAYAKQPPVGGHYVGEDIPRISERSVPRYDETSDDDNYQPGPGALPHSGAREPGLSHPGITRECQERLSRRDWYEAAARPTPAPLIRQKEVGVLWQPVVE